MLSVVSLLSVMMVSAVTPGPNNFIVLSIASASGARATLRPILGVLIGAVVMLLAVWFAADYLLDALPRFRLLIGIVGCAYLIWLGIRLIRSTGHAGQGAGPSLPRGVLPLLTLQLVNPKTWMVTFAIAGAGVAQQDDPIDLLFLMLAFPAVLGLSMVLWAGAGSLLTSLLRDAVVRKWFDRAMGTILIVSAPLMLF